MPSILLLLGVSAHAADKVTYEDHVLPIFRNSCLNCHNPDKKKAGLDLSTYQGALAGSENGKVLQSGSASASLLFKCVKGIEDPKMPPKGDRLNDAELAVIEKWISGQLLENAGGKAVAVANNNVQVAVVSLERPPGPPPMPGLLPLDPFVHASRGTALIALAASPWAPLVAVGGQKQILLYHSETLELLGVLPFPEGFPAIIRFSRNGQVLLTGGGLGGKSGKVVLWDIKTGERIATLGNEFDQVLGADLSADQQSVALGGPNKLVKIYSTRDGKLLHSIKKHSDWVTAIAYSPDGTLLASADRNGGIQVWEANTAKEYVPLPGHKQMVTSLSFMSGVLASSSEDGTVKLWDVKEGKEIRSWAAHAGGTAWVDFSPDGRLVSCGRDKTAKLWNSSGKILAQSPPFTDIALRSALSGGRLIAGDWTGEIRVCGLDGKAVGNLDPNPPALAQRLKDAAKTLADCEAAAASQQQEIDAINARIEAALQNAQTARQRQIDSLEDTAAGLAAKVLTAKSGLATPAATAGENAPPPRSAAESSRLAAQLAALEGELAKARATLETARQPLPATKPGPDQAALAKASTTLNDTNARIKAARETVTRWKRADAYMEVYRSKELLLAKEARYEAQLAAVKSAPSPAEQIGRELTLAKNAAAEAPLRVKENEELLARAEQDLATAMRAVTESEEALAQKATPVLGGVPGGVPGAAAAGASGQAKAARAELTATLGRHTTELAQLRAARAETTAGSPEYAEANAKVQAKKAVLATAQAALDAAPQAAPPAGTAPDLAPLKAALEKARAGVKATTATVASARKALLAARQEMESSTARLTKLRADSTRAMADAKAAKRQAELDLVTAQKELENARLQCAAVTEKFGAQFGS